MSKVALIAGATGLVGSSLLEKLLNSDQYSKIISLQRKPNTITHFKLETIQTDFANLNNIQLPNVDDVFCCLGTTIKTAGSKSAFIKVDYDYPMELARLASKSKAAHFLVITAMGSDAGSIFFYNQVKGKLEKNLSSLSEFLKISIIRPSLLMGDRKEHRAGEKIGVAIAKFVNPFLVGKLKKYRGIQTVDVAEAMYKIALNPSKDHVHIYLSDDLQEIATNR